MKNGDTRDFTICGACHGLRGGPIGSVGAVVVHQLCGCSSVEEHRAQPRLGDHNTALELCRCCALEALRSGSKWSVWFCDSCKQRVTALNERSGRCVMPIGRHSLMNGVSFAAGTEEATRAFANQLMALFTEINRTEDWARAAVQLNLDATGLPTDQGIELDAYLAAVARLPSLPAVKEERFAQMVESLLGRAMPAAEA